MRLVMNGREMDCETGCTLLQFLEARGVDPASVGVLLNGDVVRRSEYGDRELREGDVLQVVRFMTGGGGL